MIRKTYALLLLVALALALAAGVYTEPKYVAVSATQAAATVSFPKWTKTVSIVSDGSATCYFRLFTNVDTFVAATTAASPLKTGESLTYTLKDCAASTDLSSCKDSEGATTKPTMYVSLSHICATGATATWRVYYK